MIPPDALEVMVADEEVASLDDDEDEEEQSSFKMESGEWMARTSEELPDGLEDELELAVCGAMDTNGRFV